MQRFHNHTCTLLFFGSLSCCWMNLCAFSLSSFLNYFSHSSYIQHYFLQLQKTTELAEMNVQLPFSFKCLLLLTHFGCYSKSLKGWYTTLVIISTLFFRHQVTKSRWPRATSAFDAFLQNFIILTTTSFANINLVVLCFYFNKLKFCRIFLYCW